ncbi:hypothetical protein [Glutamicibacter sp. NPDC087344]|uniref:hypothetical protein n=1 Tax=Glutamicibacter sp. NPDC087344 TaxID=3363994 RepID=UPI00381BA674
MFVNDMLRSLIHRWYIVLAGILATAGMVYGAYVMTPVTYQAQATVILLPPEKSVAEGDNPYLYLGGLGQALNVLVISMNSAESQKELVGEQTGVGYALEQDTTTTGPIINITAVAPDSGTTMAILDQVVAQVPKTLVGLQDQLEVQANAQIGIMTLSKDAAPEEQNKKQLQLMAIAAGVGGVGTLLLAAAVDKLLTRRGAKRKNGPDDGHDLEKPNDEAKKKSRDHDEPGGGSLLPEIDLSLLPESASSSVKRSTDSSILQVRNLKAFNGF